jgi:PhnB protein
MADNPARPGFATLTTYLISNRVDELVEFLKVVFGATETYRSIGNAGGNHIELKIGDSMLMVGGGGAYTGAEAVSMFFVYMLEVDEIYKRALAAGATTLEEPNNHDYGERRAGFTDPFGNQWYVGKVISKQLTVIN